MPCKSVWKAHPVKGQTYTNLSTELEAYELFEDAAGKEEDGTAVGKRDSAFNGGIQSNSIEVRTSTSLSAVD